MGFLSDVPGQGPGIAGGAEFDLEAILARRVDSGTSMYFCQWEGYSQRTWETLCDQEPLSDESEFKGTPRDKAAVDAYFDDVLLGSRSTPSSEYTYVNGVDYMYSQFPSCLFEPLEEQVGVSNASKSRARSQLVKERARVVSSAASQVLRNDHSVMYLPFGGGAIDPFDESLLQRVDLESLIGSVQHHREAVDLAAFSPAMMSTFTRECEHLAAAFAVRFSHLFEPSSQAAPSGDLEGAVNVWMDAVVSTAAAIRGVADSCAGATASGGKSCPVPAI